MSLIRWVVVGWVLVLVVLISYWREVSPWLGALAYSVCGG